MKKLMIAAFAAVATVGAAQAAQSYGIVAAGAVAAHPKDMNPTGLFGNIRWYSCYVMKQADAQKAMGCEGTTVTYSDMATWLGENFADNKQSVIDNAEKISGAGYYGYYMFTGSDYNQGDATDAIGVFFYDDGKNYDYNVMGNSSTTAFAFSYSSSPSSGWHTDSVPEPTSGLLLLLGVAGLALKRKRQ